MFVDKSLVCVDCGATFTFSADEQEAFAARGYTNDPKRCFSCRQARKSQRPDFGGGRSDYRPRRQMFTAVCAQCGTEAQVPFQPRGDRPVYCSDCYNKLRLTTDR